MNKFKNKFSSINDQSLERLRNTRNERKVKEDLPKIIFSFKDFDIRQIPPGQQYTQWQEEMLLAYMLEKFGMLCNLNIVEAQNQGLLKIYGTFPPESDFKHPQYIIENVIWAVIMNIKGQKGRVAGHIINNVFYVVFLDKDHRFYIAEKKHT
ncbi:hypothetical protein FACS189437_03590 [Bacteroidia bacterium]|nr:hypothetical protein FACS189437_03590 [Bacteroidia bacterium]